MPTPFTQLGSRLEQAAMPVPLHPAVIRRKAERNSRFPFTRLGSGTEQVAMPVPLYLACIRHAAGCNTHRPFMLLRSGAEQVVIPTPFLHWPGSVMEEEGMLACPLFPF